MPRKYGKRAQASVRDAMHKMKRGKLKSSTGGKVKKRSQAIAIGLSEARRKGSRVPKRPGTKRKNKSNSQ